MWIVSVAILVSKSSAIASHDIKYFTSGLIEQPVSCSTAANNKLRQVVMLAVAGSTLEGWASEKALESAVHKPSRNCSEDRTSLQKVSTTFSKADWYTAEVVSLSTRICQMLLKDGFCESVVFVAASPRNLLKRPCKLPVAKWRNNDHHQQTVNILL